MPNNPAIASTSYPDTAGAEYNQIDTKHFTPVRRTTHDVSCRKHERNSSVRGRLLCNFNRIALARCPWHELKTPSKGNVKDILEIIFDSIFIIKKPSRTYTALPSFQKHKSLQRYVSKLTFINIGMEQHATPSCHQPAIGVSLNQGEYE
ncbi:hypothetical protein [Salidesulfovibrio brasiliensis]|uniref:hypothetical protein n=1 Tax=Salidesulfovibrio brasiliensis TaxID=221711 RepID=UPI0012ECF62B|nr:hypothetical protein [Salidesulfovibrio brasiliensis]